MKRKLFTLLAAISLLLCVSAIALWSRSMGREDRVVYYNGNHVFSTHVSFGAIDMTLMPHQCSYWEEPKHVLGWQFDTRPFQLSDHDSPLRRNYGLTGFLFGTNPYYFCYLPLWFVSILCMLLPLARPAQWVRIRRAANAGRCPACGYDLRATPERCPECGRAASDGTQSTR